MPLSHVRRDVRKVVIAEGATAGCGAPLESGHDASKGGAWAGESHVVVGEACAAIFLSLQVALGQGQLFAQPLLAGLAEVGLAVAVRAVEARVIASAILLPVPRERRRGFRRTCCSMFR